MAIDKYDSSFQDILKTEGGYSNHPNDPGGPTNKGITIGTLAEYRGVPVTIKDVKALTDAEVKLIYKQKYWDKIRGDEIDDPQIANMIFDQRVNKGTRVGGHVQEILGLPVDNIVGSQTIAKLNSLNEEEKKAFKESFLVREQQDYHEIAEIDPKKKDFLDGWEARLNNLAIKSGVAPLTTSISKRTKKDTGVGHKAYIGSTFVPNSPDYRDFNTSEFDKVDSGGFRFNDILLDIPPESIEIIINEHTSSFLMLRNAAPTTVQNGKKRVRIVVNFAIDLAADVDGYFDLSRMLIQIRKTPIATIENEKIRSELFGDIVDHANIGVIVDNITGYIEEDFPTLLRCTLQMSWFNHTPYVAELRYLDELSTGEIITQKFPSAKFAEFYTSGTLIADQLLINNPAASKTPNDLLTIMYKHYQQFNVSTEVKSTNSIDAGTPSKLDPNRKVLKSKDRETIDDLLGTGWHRADENDTGSDIPDGVFYKWKKFEIPFTDLDGSGSLILQNMSFSLSTNPSYIEMEQHSIPTIQFLGGSSASMRAIIFAAAEYQSENVKMPIATSYKLGQLQTILKQVTENRLSFPKYAKENHLLIAHPLAKLMKYQAEGKSKYGYYVTDETPDKNGEIWSRRFNINDFLPVVISDTNSSTINGLPFASRFQIDFKETRLAKHKKNIKGIGETSSAKPKTAYRKVIEKLADKFNIKFDAKSSKFGMQAFALSSDSIEANKIVQALNGSYLVDNTVTSIDLAFNSPYFFWSYEALRNEPKRREVVGQADVQAEINSKHLLESDNKEVAEKAEKDRRAAREAAFQELIKIKKASRENEKKTKRLEEEKILKDSTLIYTKAQEAEYKLKSELESTDKNVLTNAEKKKREIRDNAREQLNNIRKTSKPVSPSLLKTSTFFTSSFVNIFLLEFYMVFIKALQNGDDWTTNYIEEFEEFVTYSPDINVDLYPDMMIPVDEMNPAFYFANNLDRVTDYKKKIVQNMPGIAAQTDKNISLRALNKNFANEVGGEVLPGTENFPLAFNMFTYQEMKDKGLGVAQRHNDQDYRILNAQRIIRDMSPPNHSINQVYPTFQVQLFSDRYNYLQKYSAADIKANLYQEEEQKDLLDIFDLSSIIDIRIIKDESEAADVMVIRVMTTSKGLVSKTQDVFYDQGEFTAKSIFEGIIGDTRLEGVDNTGGIKASVIKKYDANLARAGMKEGTKIKALLGYVNDINALSIEFSGRIAAINGSDILEIYCVGNGHELIQNTLGFDKDSSSYSLNSDTTDLLSQLLAKSPEVKSFGNTKFEIGKGISINAPSLMGGRSALDNIYAPTIHPSGHTIENFSSGVFSATLKSITYSISAMGVAALIPLTAGLVAGVSLGAVAVIAGVVGFVGASLYQTYIYIKKKLKPANFTAFQQTIWDVMQEMTLRHPGYICSIVPFDNRSTIYFGEPDGTFFYRGPQSALEKLLKNYIYDSPRKTMREIWDQKQEFKDEQLVEGIDDPTMIVSGASAQERLKSRKEKYKKSLQNADIEQLSMDAMQKSFRDYHLITSEHDIVANQIEASSKDVANSVQVYHPSSASDVNFDGAQYIDDYELTKSMKADDDLYSHLINNKIFTFHNAHKDFPEIELPQRYAKAILCKELEKIYKGKIVILGRPNIKPHDIVVLRDTYNDMSGPVGVRRVVQNLSPQTGWVTIIYPKFIAIPDTSSGAFQMANVLKAARFWLGDEVDLFYSSMEKFNPTENTGAGKEGSDFNKAAEMLINPNKDYDITKEDVATQGDEVVGTIANHLPETRAAVLGAGQLAGDIISPALTASAIKSGKRTLRLGKAASTAAFAAAKNGGLKAGALRGGGGLLKVGVSTAKTGLKLGGAGLGLFAGFGLTYLMDTAIEGFISWAKYRQPVYIFPLKKDGKPWMAALNGFKENTPLEHIQFQVAQAADVFGSYNYYARDFLNGWVGGNANSTSLTLKESFGRVVNETTFELKTGEKIKILGLFGINDNDEEEIDNEDTPFNPRAEQEKIKLKESTMKKIEKLLQGQEITVERAGRDKFGNTLANVSVSDKDIASLIKEN